MTTPLIRTTDDEYDDWHSIGEDDIGWHDSDGPCLFGDQCTIPDPFHKASECVSVEMMESYYREMESVCEHDVPVHEFCDRCARGG